MIAVWFGVLGTLTVLDGERQCAPTAAKPRALLALLLAQAGQVVPVHRLVLDLWDGEPPATANTALQVYVHQARRLLLPGRTGRDAAQPLKLEQAGYRLDLTGHTCDLVEFDRLAKTGVEQLRRGDPESASATLREALALWRGPAFSDIATRSVQEEHAKAVERRRTAALACRIDADLQLGRYADLVPELTRLVGAHPLNERLAERLMTALAGSGRQVDALEVYRDVRRRVRQQSGAEPSPALRRLQHAILSQDFAGPAARPSAPAARAEAGQLPLDTPDFTGRDGAMASLRELLTGTPGRSGTRVCLITGPAGVGKTALVVHAAHRLAEHFPDGRLYADLRGFDDDPAAPADPADVLATWLEALGHGRRSLAEDLEGRSRQFRTAIAGRRLLVVIDNAVSEAQVRPLLPSEAGSAVLVTGRQQLAGLEGVDRLRLEVPEPGEALWLFTAILGQDRVAGYEDDAVSIVASCGRLPLAVRIAATRLAASPSTSLREFADRLGAATDRLGELAVGDLQVRAAFAAGYQACSEPERRAFRRLSVLSAPHFPSWVVAAAVDADQVTGEQLVESLVEKHLLQVIRRDDVGQLRYGFHDLVRVYAEERLAAEESELDRRAVVARITGGYGALAAHAEAVTSPARNAHRADARPAWDPVEHGCPPLPDDELITWVETESECLVSAVGDALRADVPEQVVLLADQLLWFFELRGDWDRWELVLEHAERAAAALGELRQEAIVRQLAGRLAWNRNQVRETVANLHRARQAWTRLGDKEALAQVLCQLSIVRLHWGTPRRTIAALDRCSPVFLANDDKASQATVLYVRGDLHYDQGAYSAAEDCFRRSAELFDLAGDRRSRAKMLVKLAGAQHRLGRGEEVGKLYAESLSVFRDFRDDRLESWTLGQLARVHRANGRPIEAMADLTRARMLCTRIGDRRMAAHILLGVGELNLDQGRYTEAEARLREALAEAERIGDLRAGARIHRALAEVERATGRFAEAAAGFRKAADVFGVLGMRHWQGRALTGLGLALSEDGRRCQAIQVWRQALDILRRTSDAEAEQVASLLYGPDGPRAAGDVA